MLKRLIQAACLMTFAASLSACSTMAPPGSLNGLGGDPMPMTVTHKNPFYGEYTTEDHKVVVTLAQSCKKDADRQMASTAETVLTSAGINAVGGAVGLAGGAKGAFGKAVSAVDYGIYGAAANGASGAVQGLQTQSFAKSAVVGSCINGDLQDAKVRQIAPGVHVYSSFVRTNNSSKAPPPWAKRVDGPQASSDQSADEEEGPSGPVSIPPL
ncbi:MAG: hypothetical protein AAB883_00200 [Patescibacteria group bacterium]